MSLKQFSLTLRLCLLLGAILAGLCCQSSSLTQPPSVSATEPPEIADAKVTFLAVGDILLSRRVAQRMKAANDPLLPFRKLEPLLKSTDFNFGNLETPISGKDEVLGIKRIFNMRKQDIVGLLEYNFKVVNLANNHAFDQGLAGLKFTRQILEDRGITYLGVGDNLGEAWQPKVFSVNGVRIGFIGASYASFNDGGVARNDYIARIEDLEHLRNAVLQLKSQADFIIVTMHAGTEFVDKADARRALDRTQIKFARAAVDYGADLVIGAHPHWIQNLETYRGKYIFYSLGNFIFDMHDPIANEGLVLKITLRRKQSNSASGTALDNERRAKFSTYLEQIECIPVIIENLSTPRLATQAEAERTLNRLGLPQILAETQ